MKIKAQNIASIKGSKTEKSQNSLSAKDKVDINILLNRIRLDNKKEKFKNLSYSVLLTLFVIIAGVIASV